MSEFLIFWLFLTVSFSLLFKLFTVIEDLDFGFGDVVFIGSITLMPAFFLVVNEHVA